MATQKDKEILRALAGQHRELAADDANHERVRRMRDINGLKPARPAVWIEEIPWHEMDIDGELRLTCEDEDAKNIERYFRRIQYRWKYIQADMIVEDCYYISKAFDSTGIGVNIREETLSADNKNHIVSHHYEDQLDTEDKIERLHCPVITARPDIDRQNLEKTQDLLGDILPVRLRGHAVIHAPWDTIGMLRGVEPVLIDMMERPEFLHSTIEKFTEIGFSQYKQMETQGLLDYNISDIHCTPPFAEELPAKDYDGGIVRLKDVWFRGMAQIFASVSPAMHEEFELHYARRLMDQGGLAYYGCCEPLDNKLELLMKIPNMRKIGVSPWANASRMAEQMGNRYVFARKPNPAFVADHFDAEVVKKEISETLEACRKNNCPCEFVLKDISTVSYRPENLIRWNQTVQDVINGYYV